MRLAVVGAGSIGLAVAWRAAQAGAEVVVHDPDPGSGASRVAAGMIAPVTEAHYGEEALAPFMAESADAWPAFARALEAASGLEVGFRDVPTLLVGLEDGDRAEIDRQAELYRCTAREVEVLTARAARKVEPLLSHRVRGGVLAPEDRAVDPRAVHAALLVAAERAGVELRRERVSNLDALDADQVVLAAGCGSARFAGGVGSNARGVDRSSTADPSDVQRGDGAQWNLPGGDGAQYLPGGDRDQWNLPVRPVRGAVLRLRAVGEQPTPRTTVRGFVKGHAVYIVTRENGEVVVGATSDERGFDRLTGTAGAVHDLLRWSIELVPEIAEYHLDEVSVGFRPGTPDNLPLIGRLDERTVAATGHYRNGIALIPATATAVVALLEGAAGAPPKAFDPLRFSGVGEQLGPQFGGSEARSVQRIEGTAQRTGVPFAGAPESIVPTGSDKPWPRIAGGPRDSPDNETNGTASEAIRLIESAEDDGRAEDRPVDHCDQPGDRPADTNARVAERPGAPDSCAEDRLADSDARVADRLRATGSRAGDRHGGSGARGAGRPSAPVDPHPNGNSLEADS